ncbi:MAG: DNA/RNA non-specific endonuclease [Bacteroidales bacterium]|nr:DNA/RNA non-specific endonuclease [Bacteroidales bacterium]MBO5942935.1 DNA/RNA non-specific endonuclease [Bacteroidales bacterium]
MKKIVSIFRFTAVLTLISALVFSSCDPLGSTGIGVEVFGITIKNPKVDSGKGQQFVNVKCSGEWTLTLVSEDGTPDWATLSVDSGVGDKSNVVLSYGVNDGENTRTLTIYLDNGSQTVSCKMEQLPAGQRPDDDIDDPNDDPNDGQTGNVDLAKTGWLELPAMDNPNLGYYAHHFKMNGKTYRNYSFGWSQKDRVALWVAYPLCKLYTNGNVGRTNAWALDPLLGEDSAAPFGGYAGDYARGHQLPSADRQCCYDANAQTFYGTNMTPQLNAHNEKIWADLENKVRGYANTSDTTYVVTGVIVSPSSKKERDSYGQSVTIPDAYFKAVLKYSKSSTLGAWNAAAFYLEHRAYSGSVSKEHSMSIDELEEMTGIDFFVNLPAKIGEDQAAKLEAADPANSSVWW